MFDFLSDNLLIICPNSYKLAILDYLNENKKIVNIKFMTLNEYKKSVDEDESNSKSFNASKRSGTNSEDK